MLQVGPVQATTACVINRAEATMLDIAELYEYLAERRRKLEGLGKKPCD
jgi:hypothetical protein